MNLDGFASVDWAFIGWYAAALAVVILGLVLWSDR